VSEYVYLYGFVPSDAPQPDRITGIADRAVQLVRAGEVQAAISLVPAADYTPARIEARLQDLKWVAEQGVAHERVVAWFVDNSQILPVALFTMYSSVSAVQSAARDQQTELLAQMQRLRGFREWDLKVSFDETVLQTNAAQVSVAVAELDQQIAAAPAGKGYLLQKKRADVLKTEVRQAAHRQAIDVLNLLHNQVEEQRILPLPRTADDLPVVLHAALLVNSAREQDVVATLEAETARLRALGIEVSFSGPWAPYRFMSDNEQ
jgi:hypothetical protein